MNYITEILFGSESEEKCVPVIRKERQTHYRAHIASICYPEILLGISKTSAFDMPVIKPNTVIPSVLKTTPFDRVVSKRANRNSLVVFYINDVRCAKRLTHPWSYTTVLQQYQGVVAPDLSQFRDMDYAQRISNSYWNKVFTVYWQNQNVNIYPNVTWSLPDSYEYSLAGFPRRSVIAINSMGILKDNFGKSAWLDGYHYMVSALDPICILRYGPKVYGEIEDISLYLENEQVEILRHGRKWK